MVFGEWLRLFLAILAVGTTMGYYDSGDLRPCQQLVHPSGQPKPNLWSNIRARDIRDVLHLNLRDLLYCWHSRNEVFPGEGRQVLPLVRILFAGDRSTR